MHARFGPSNQTLPNNTSEHWTRTEKSFEMGFMGLTHGRPDKLKIPSVRRA